MIKFSDVRTGDREFIQHYTLWGKRRNCDLSFANIISWRFLYDTQYAVIDDYLIFRFHTGRHLAYMAPIPKPVPQADGTYSVPDDSPCPVAVIEQLREDAIAMGRPFLMIGVCQEMVDSLEKGMPGIFDCLPQRDYFDYIYLRDKLINLSGKKLQSKRNHINKFKALYPDYEYRPLTKEMIPQCMQLEAKWRKNMADVDENSEVEAQLAEELRSMTRVFMYWDDLDITGGSIFVKGQLIAFTYGCPINQNTFDVCVEKADINYQGSFSIINEEFVKHLPEQYLYINREEDLGDEGLRRSKLSYKPDILLEKYSITESQPLAQFVDQNRIKNEVKELWRKTFKDTEDFINLYFDKVYQNEYNIVSQIGGKVVGALQTLPYDMRIHQCVVKTVYISGVSVDEAFRRQNIGTSLMQQAHDTLYYEGVVFATLIPAEKWLYNWYASCGYVQKITCTSPPENIRKMTFEDFDKWQKTKDCVLLHDRKGYEVIQEDISRVPADTPIQEHSIPAMIRVINAQKALDVYAQVHPDLKMNFRIHNDRHIRMNNQYIGIEDGKAKATDLPLENAKVLTISELAEFLFADETPEMNLMLN
ncbi:GNAT family N-acetyltransferase [Prevotella cerevisiae]|uniref:GNAT family N-acetyltransferase n=1 Tax=Segatella cerevisiae TaxID=2053716 RepID=A0ABT1BX18_9BACT|nr:GNAT family N-acetyltransferase [Segatella cerevisiae]MCO6025375.1 GNAT family N-acetyltransferase [Segatella cerevisiae]